MFDTGIGDGDTEKGGVMSHDLKECETCGFRFPNEYSRRVHICENGPKESDDKMLAFLHASKDEKKNE